MLLGRRGRSRAATVADGAWEDEMRLLARKLSQHRDRPRHRFLGSQGLNYGWSNIFVNLCCSRIGASFDVAVALCQTMLSRLAPKASVFLSVFKGACVNLCCCQPPGCYQLGHDSPTAVYLSDTEITCPARRLRRSYGLQLGYRRWKPQAERPFRHR